MYTRSNIQRRADVARSSTTLSTTVSPSLFVLPWQALVLTVVLTMGGTVHAFPQTFAPVLSYAHGMTMAAIEWHDMPATSTCESASR